MEAVTFFIYLLVIVLSLPLIASVLLGVVFAVAIIIYTIRTFLS